MPITTTTTTPSNTITVDLAESHKFKPSYGDDYSQFIPKTTQIRFNKSGIDISKGYSRRASSLIYYLDKAHKATSRTEEGSESFIERGKFADKSKRHLFSKVTELKDLTKYIGTEIIVVQFSELSDVELDELALLASERVVIFLRNQTLSPQEQLRIGEHWGHEVEKHPITAHIPLPDIQGSTGIATVWGEFNRKDLLLVFKRLAGDLFHRDQLWGFTLGCYS